MGDSEERNERGERVEMAPGLSPPAPHMGEGREFMNNNVLVEDIKTKRARQIPYHYN